MPLIHNYGLSGLNNSVQFGKTGGQLVFDPVANRFTFTQTDISSTASVSVSDVTATTGDITVSDSTKSFSLAGTKLSLDSPGIFKMDSATAVMIPLGNDSDRPSNSKVGMIRVNNTAAPFVEYYNGSVWQSVGTAIGAGTVTSVGLETAGTGLTVSGTNPITSSGTFTISGTLNATTGGTGINAYTTGDMLYSSATNTLQKLSIGTSGQILSVKNSAPSWVDSGSATISFDYGDATPKNLNVIPANAVVTDVTLIITTPFNGTGGSISIGDAAVNNRLMLTSDNTVYVTGTYSVEPGYKYSSSTQLLLYITPGSSSAGSGLVIINYK